MSHHGSLDDEILRREAKALKLGSTGRFPEGILTPHDEGEINISIAGKDGKVVLNFGKAVHWIGFNPEQARRLSKSLRKMAKKVDTSQRERR